MTATVTTQRTINPGQLDAELGSPGVSIRNAEGPIREVTAFGAVSQAQLVAAVAAHVADLEWGPDKAWRETLLAEIEVLNIALENPATNWLAAAAVRRLARNQLRILRFIRDNTHDEG